MNPLALAFAFFAAASPTAAQDLPPIPGYAGRTEINLAGEFPDRPLRTQEQVGSCHDFASIGLLEAALKRTYGVSLRLSEADVFAHTRVVDPGYYSNAEIEPNGRIDFREGGVPARDIQYVINHGAATSRDVPYSAMLPRYYKYENQMRAVVGAETSVLSMLGADANQVLAANAAASAAATPQAKADVTRSLIGADPRAARDRDVVHRALHGYFRVQSFANPFWGETWSSIGHGDNDMSDLSSSKIQESAAAVESAILEQLRANRPVAVTMDIGGLTGWGLNGVRKAAMHCFIIYGVKSRLGGRVYLTRNSWNGYNPPIPAFRLGRIVAFAYILGPGEIAKTPPESLKGELAAVAAAK